jgi:hypothetical protein
MNLISVRIVKSAAFECDCAGVVEETSSPASAVGGSSWEPVLTLPRREQSGSRSSGRPLDCQSAFKYCRPNDTRSRPSEICGHSAVSGLWKDPSDAHHIKFAEQRAMGRKVSDRFTVPICRLHHRELHRRGNERAWWQNRGSSRYRCGNPLGQDACGRTRDCGRQRPIGRDQQRAQRTSS